MPSCHHRRVSELDEQAPMIEVQAAWPELAANAPVPVNQFALVAGTPLRSGDSDGLAILMVGHVAQPLLSGVDAARRFWQAHGNALAVEVQGAFLLSDRRLEELYEVIGRHLGKGPVQ